MPSLDPLSPGQAMAKWRRVRIQWRRPWALGPRDWNPKTTLGEGSLAWPQASRVHGLAMTWASNFWMNSNKLNIGILLC